MLLRKRRKLFPVLAVMVMLAFFSLQGCAFFRAITGEDQPTVLGSVVSTYAVSVPPGFITTKMFLETKGYTEPKITEVKTKYNFAVDLALQGGNDLKAFVADPQMAFIVKFPEVLKQATDLLVDLVGAKYVAAPTVGKSVVMPEALKAQIKASNLKYGYTITPDQIVMALNALIALTEFFVNKFADMQPLSPELKAQYTSTIDSAMSKIVKWE